MREILCAIVLVSAALAGCIGAEDDRPVDASGAAETPPEDPANASAPTLPDGTPAPTSLEVRDCTEQGGTFPVPASAYEDRIPEGFSLTPYGALFGTQEPSGETAELVLLGVECQRPDGTTARTALAYLLVEPPEEWRNPNASFGHALALALVTSSEERAAVYEAWGLGPVTTDGEIGLAAAETPAAQAGTLEVSGEDGGLRVDTAVEGQPSEFDGALLRLFAADEDGTVTGAADLDWTSIQVTIGSAAAAGSGGFGTLDGAPAQPGVGFHNWGFNEVDRYVDLPPREGS